ncbi:hypothetical protein Ccrd_025902, partial [Cynara cardunculus var. scolymus]
MSLVTHFCLQTLLCVKQSKLLLPFVTCWVMGKKFDDLRFDFSFTSNHPVRLSLMSSSFYKEQLAKLSGGVSLP